MTWRDDFGKQAELLVCSKLQDLGIAVEHIGSNCEYDLVIGGCARGEVKCAIRTKARDGRSARWQFSFGRNGKVNDEELVFLVCYENDAETPAGIFVIPGSAISPELRKIDITSSLDRYKGRWATYLDNWTVVRSVLAACQNTGVRLSRVKLQEEIPF